MAFGPGRICFDMPARRLTLLRIGAGAILLGLASLFAQPVSAHPLGNFTVNRAIVIEIGGRVEIRYLIDMAEIPTFEAIQQLDADDDNTTEPDEVRAYASATCDDALGALTVTIDGDRARLHEAAPPGLSFPAGAGGLETLRLECHFLVDATVDPAIEHGLEVRDGTDDGRLGWREMTARPRGDAIVTASDVPAVSPSAELTSYPQDALQAPPDVRAATLSFRTGAVPIASSSLALATPSSRGTATDPLAALAGGELSPLVIVLAMLLALGLGALHALSPGHGKTLVAAYVLGAGGDARSAVQIGLSVAVSHTAGVFALGVLTLLASELFLPERVIGWLSLVSGIVVAGLGLVLLARQWPRIRRLTRGRPLGRPARSTHLHNSAGGHDHDHEHGHGRAHSHAVPAGSLTWRSALALGFAGGAVPSASAVIVLLVAISSDRVLFGSLLIAMFGIGMAVVLGGLGLLIARVGSVATRAEGGWLGSPWARRFGPWVPVVAGTVVLVSGLAFAVTAATQLS